MEFLGGRLLYKKGVLLVVLLCTMSMTGCIVINTGESDKPSEDNSSTNKTT